MRLHFTLIPSLQTWSIRPQTDLLPFKPHTLQPPLPLFMTYFQSGGQRFEFEKVLIRAKADPSGPQRLPANISALLNSY